MKILRQFTLLLTLSLFIYPTTLAHAGIPELSQIATNAATFAARTTATAWKTAAVPGNMFKLEGASISISSNVVVQLATIFLDDSKSGRYLADCLLLPTHALRFSTSTNQVTVYFGDGGCGGHIIVSASGGVGSRQHFADYSISAEICQITDAIFAQVDAVNAAQPNQRPNTARGCVKTPAQGE